MNEKPEEKPHLFDKPENVQRLLRGFYVVCGVLLALDLIDWVLRLTHAKFHLRHIEFHWEGLPGFYPVYGFVACVLLVLIAKQMRKGLMRGEDYYDQ